MEKVILRKINKKDINLLFKWANLKTVIKNSLNRKKIKFQEHEIWFNRQLNSKKNIIKIIYVQETPIGTIRLNKKLSKYYLSYMISPKYRRKGYALISLRLFLKKIKNAQKRENILAIVKKNNIPSIKIFNKLNFSLVSSKSNVFKFLYKL